MSGLGSVTLAVWVDVAQSHRLMTLSVALSCMQLNGFAAARQPPAQSHRQMTMSESSTYAAFQRAFQAFSCNSLICKETGIFRSSWQKCWNALSC